MRTEAAGAWPFQPADTFRVALVCMPFFNKEWPSIQLGLLRAATEQAGFRTDTYHLNLELAARLRRELYASLCSRRSHVTGEGGGAGLSLTKGLTPSTPSTSRPPRPTSTHG